MTNRALAPSFFQSFSIKRTDFPILERIAKAHGLTASMVEEPVGDTRKTGDSASASVTGDNADLSMHMTLIGEYYDATHREEQVGGNHEK